MPDIFLFTKQFLQNSDPSIRRCAQNKNYQEDHGKLNILGNYYRCAKTAYIFRL